MTIWRTDWAPRYQCDADRSRMIDRRVNLVALIAAVCMVSFLWGVVST